MTLNKFSKGYGYHFTIAPCPVQELSEVSPPTPNKLLASSISGRGIRYLYQLYISFSLSVLRRAGHTVFFVYCSTLAIQPLTIGWSPIAI